MHDIDDDTAKYQALEREMAEADRAEGIDRGGYGAQPAEAEAYAEQHGVPQQPPAQQDYGERHEPAAQMPDVDEDPIAHFTGRMQQMEGVVGQQHQADVHRNLRDFVERSERAADDEFRGDYKQAVEHLESAHRAKLERQFPDGHQTDLLAHQYGLPNAAAMRDAMLNRDRATVVSHALQNGRDPASDYYRLAQEYGYRPKVGFSKSQMKNLLAAAEQNSKTFDDEWEKFAKAERRADEARRSR